jgi:hypothetical protein
LTFAGNRTFSTQLSATFPKNKEVFVENSKETTAERCPEQYHTFWAGGRDPSLSSTTLVMSSFKLMSNEAPDYRFVLYTEREMQSMDVQIYSMRHSAVRRAKPLAISDLIKVCDGLSYKGFPKAGCKEIWKHRDEVGKSNWQKTVWDSSTNTWKKAPVNANGELKDSGDSSWLTKPTQAAQIEGALKWKSNSERVFWIAFPPVLIVLAFFGILAFLYKDVLAKKFGRKRGIAL